MVSLGYVPTFPIHLISGWCIILFIMICTINRFSPSAVTPTMTSSDSLPKPFSTIPYGMWVGSPGVRH